MGQLNHSGITTSSNGKETPQFNTHGRPYDSLVGVAIRIGQLAYENHVMGDSDGRVTEMYTIMDDLEAYATTHGADHPQEAVRMALESVRFINSHVTAPVLTLHEEMEIAIINTNEGRRTGSIN